jgi:deoxyguanosine kinase
MAELPARVGGSPSARLDSPSAAAIIQHLGSYAPQLGCALVLRVASYARRPRTPLKMSNSIRDLRRDAAKCGPSSLIVKGCQGLMLIVIEGCLGAGKSTVAAGLAEHRNSKVLLENFETNPFLKAFYENPREYATETEFGFLLLHFHQLKNLSHGALNAETIADFHLGKDLIYADLNLDDTRVKRLFNQLYDLCLEKIPRPALMVCLSAPTDLLIERIRSRKRALELNIDRGYLATVNAAYEVFFEAYTGPKVRLRMEEWDFVKDAQLFETLSSLIDRELGTT